MTIEEKAKAYDEALEKAKEHMNSKGIGDTVDLCKHLFPQLRESEDERIRKEIIGYLNSRVSTAEETELLYFKRWIAWLEKQKGQKPTATINGEPIPIENHSVDIPLAEWSEEDEEMLDAMIDMVSNSLYEPLCPRERMLAWLKSLRPSWKPSEDEERLINTSISFLKDFADKGYENAVECIDWLKSKLNGNTCK